MFKFIFLLSLFGQVATATTALQTCEALLTAKLPNTPNANLLLTLREVQEILEKRADRAEASPLLDTFYGDVNDIIPPVAATLRAKVHAIESALTDPNDAQMILFARIIRGERTIRSGLMRVDTALKTLDASYKSTLADTRRRPREFAQWATLVASNITLMDLLFKGHAPLWLGLPILGAALASDVQAFKNMNHTGFVGSQVAFDRTRRTLSRLLEADPTQMAIQTDHLLLPQNARNWLAAEKEFAPPERGEGLRANSTGVNRGWPWQRQTKTLKDFRVEHIAYFDEYSGEPTWVILLVGPRAPKASTIYRVR